MACSSATGTRSGSLHPATPLRPCARSSGFCSRRWDARWRWTRNARAVERAGETGCAMAPAMSYRYDPERGPIEIHGSAADAVVSGRTLLDMARDDYSDPLTQQQAKVLMRSLLDHRLEYQPLKSRRIFRDLLDL